LWGQHKPTEIPLISIPLAKGMLVPQFVATNVNWRSKGESPLDLFRRSK